MKELSPSPNSFLYTSYAAFYKETKFPTDYK